MARLRFRVYTECRPARKGPFFNFFFAKQQMQGESQVTIELIGCLVEVVADDEGRIDLKCFEKIINACVKSVIIGLRIGDQVAELLKSQSRERVSF